MARTLIGNIKGPKGDTGETGATGATGAAGASASVSVGTVTALEYGNNPTVTNSGSAQNAVFNFGIPKGKPADNITELDNLPVNSSVTPSDDFPVPAVGDTSKTILGKIIKWFSDMSALVATKLNVANVVNNLTTTSSGYALDARQGKALNDALTFKDGGAVSALNSDIAIPAGATELIVRVLILSDDIGWVFPIYTGMLSSTRRTYSVGGTGSTSNAFWGADIQADTNALKLTRVTRAGSAATSFQLAIWYR